MTRVLRSHALLATHSVEDAFREAQVATLLDPDDDSAQLALALAAWRSRRITLAQQAFERAVDRSGQKAEVAAQYAWFLASEQAAQVGARAAERVIGQSPRIATAWAALGLSQFRLQRSEQAEQSLRRALEIDPHNPEAQSAMIRLLKRRGEHRQADLLNEMLEQERRKFGRFVEGPADWGKDPPALVAPQESDVSDLASPQRQAAWARRVSTMLVGFALLLTCGTLALRAPVIGAVSLGASFLAVVIAKKMKWI